MQFTLDCIYTYHSLARSSNAHACSHVYITGQFMQFVSATYTLFLFLFEWIVHAQYVWHGMKQVVAFGPDQMTIDEIPILIKPTSGHVYKT